MLFLRYCSFLLPLAVVFGCFSCESASTKKAEVPAVDTLSQRLDSIGFEPYVQSLIKNGSFINFELIGKPEGEAVSLLKDSLYYTMSNSDWFLYGLGWAYGNDEYTFYTRKKKGEDIENFIKNHIPDYSSHLYNMPASLEGIVKHVLDSIKVAKPYLNFSDSVLVCGGIDMLIYDGHKFYYLSGSYGQPTKQFMERLAPIYSRYFNEYKKNRKQKRK